MTPKLGTFATVGLCGLLVACADSTPNAAELTSTAAAQNQNQSTDDDTTAADFKSLPTDLDGEVRRAQLLRAQGDYQGAAASLARLMLSAPDDPRVIGEYGKVLVQEGRSQDALAFLNRAIELQPNDWMLYSAQGVAYDQLGDPDKAKVAYVRALSLKPGNASVLNNYAMSRVLAGDLPEAQKLLAQAKGDDPRIAANQTLVAELEAGKSVGITPAAPAAKPAAPVVGPAPAAYASASNPQVVMQAVPADPKAGPVRSAAAKPHPAVAHAKPKGPTAVAAKSSPVPELRTAADLRTDVSTR